MKIKVKTMQAIDNGVLVEFYRVQYNDTQADTPDERICSDDAFSQCKIMSLSELEGMPSNFSSASQQIDETNYADKAEFIKDGCCDEVCGAAKRVGAINSQE